MSSRTGQRDAPGAAQGGRRAEGSQPGSDEQRAFHIEHHGIDFIPLRSRWARPRNLFGMWAGALTNFEMFIYGAVLMVFGFTLAQAAILIIVGNVSFVLLGVASLQGPDAGTTTFTISRAPFGPNGNRMVGLFNWLTLIGFETEGLALVVLAAVALAEKAGFGVGTPLKVVFIILAAVLQLLLPMFGYATIVKVLRWLIVPFVLLFVVLAVLTLGKVEFHHGLSGGPGWPTFMAGLAFVIVATGLGWTMTGNDFSRYLPPQVSRRSIVGWVMVGTVMPSVLLMLLGAAVATFVPEVGNNPISDLPRVFSSWFLGPFLAVAIVQLFAINSLDLYSSGVTLQAIGLRLERWKATLIDTVVAGGLTAYAIFSASFSTLLSDFLFCVIVWIGPWTAIFLVDWLLRRLCYVPTELQRRSGGLYWRRGGVFWPAVVAQILGMAAAVLALDTPFYVSPISSATGGADFSVFTGMATGALVYLVLARRVVRREAAEQSRLLDEAARSAGHAVEATERA